MSFFKEVFGWTSNNPPDDAVDESLPIAVVAPSLIRISKQEEFAVGRAVVAARLAGLSAEVTDLSTPDAYRRARVVIWCGSSDEMTGGIRLVPPDRRVDAVEHESAVELSDRILALSR